MMRQIKKSLEQISFQFSQNLIQESSRSIIPPDLPLEYSKSTLPVNKDVQQQIALSIRIDHQEGNKYSFKNSNHFQYKNQELQEIVDSTQIFKNNHQFLQKWITFHSPFSKSKGKFQKLVNIIKPKSLSNPKLKVEKENNAYDVLKRYHRTDKVRSISMKNDKKVFFFKENDNQASPLRIHHRNNSSKLKDKPRYNKKVQNLCLSEDNRKILRINNLLTKLTKDSNDNFNKKCIRKPFSTKPNTQNTSKNYKFPLI